MDVPLRPRRSALYIPGSKPRALAKARSLSADVLIMDLEDAVLPGEKVAARGRLVEIVRAGGFGGREVVVRVNGADTEWGHGDLEAAAAARPSAVLLPKVESADAIDAAARVLDASGGGEIAVWAMIETSAGVLSANRIARAPRTGCLVMGTNDLAADLTAVPDAARAQLMVALQQVVLAARAHGAAALDGVYNAFRDRDGFARECRQARALGFDGKTLIHPDQIAAANQVFAPDDATLERARRQLAAFAEAEAAGQGVAVLDGRIVENLHAAAARRLLARKKVIDSLQAEVAP